MNTPAKIGLVVAGYIAAALVAAGVVAIYVASTGGPDRQTYGGMYAFGDDLLLLAVFGVAAVPATGAALFFLRPWRSFWRVLSVVALVVAATGVAASIVSLSTQGAGAGSPGHSWTAFAVLRILVAPLFALAFFLSALFAPTRFPRIALFVATLAEAGAFASIAVVWFHSIRP